MSLSYQIGLETQEGETILVFADDEDSRYRNGMGSNLRLARDVSGLSQEALAELVGTTQVQIGRLEAGKRKLTKEWAERLAPHLKVTPAYLLNVDGMTSVVGYVGAGGYAEYLEGADLGQAPRPPGFSANGVALQVRGDSMPGVAEDNWLIYYDERFDAPSDDMLGQLCVIQITDGPVLVKRLYRGGLPGTFDLVSTSSNYDPIRNAHLQWVAKVDWIKPR